MSNKPNPNSKTQRALVLVDRGVKPNQAATQVDLAPPALYAAIKRRAMQNGSSEAQPPAAGTRSDMPLAELLLPHLPAQTQIAVRLKAQAEAVSLMEIFEAAVTDYVDPSILAVWLTPAQRSRLRALTGMQPADTPDTIRLQRFLTITGTEETATPTAAAAPDDKRFVL